jgi:hypothetical protein
VREYALLKLQSGTDDLGRDPQQQCFIGQYMALAHFSLGHYPQAAHQWLLSLNHCISFGNVRGMAGSIEGCG